MLLLKILIASVIVIGLAELAERSSTKMAGILAGLPVGSALVLFFYGLDFGAVYVDKVTPYNLLGLSASLSFVTFYYFGSTLSERFSMLSGISLGLSAYLFIAYFLSFVRIENAVIPALLLSTLIFITHTLFKKIPDAISSKSGKLKPMQILGRGIVATFFVLAASYSPRLFSDEMAGILSSFPSSILPLLLILHLSQGKAVTQAVIKYLPLGYIGVMIYSIVVGQMYVDFGVYMGTLLSLVISTSYLLIFLLLGI